MALADGRVVTDEGTGEEIRSPDGPVVSYVDIATATVARTVEPGAEFEFTFDLGDDWTHRCVVDTEKIDPVEVLGVGPDRPLPYFGWGSIPDQYGRRWADDDGQGRPPRRPDRPHPMLVNRWPAEEHVLPLDLSELRASVASNDAGRFLAAVRGRELDDVLQQVGAGIPMALEQQRKEAEPVVQSVVSRLTEREEAGDDVLAEDLLARLRGEPLAGRELPVDLDLLSTELEGDLSMSLGGYLDLHTGAVLDDSATDAAMVGNEAVVDVDEEPDRWLWFDRTGSREGWKDMAAFAGRQLGRAREFLAAEGIRVGTSS